MALPQSGPSSDRGRPIVMAQTKEGVPESWEELESPTSPKGSTTDSTFGWPAEEATSSTITQSPWKSLPSPNEGIPIVAGQTPYVPQVTKILVRPSKPGDTRSTIPAKGDNNGPRASLTLEEKQRRYAEARKRIFTEGGK